MYYQDSVEIKNSKYGGKGLFTTKPFKYGQTIISVPQEYFIYYDKLINKYPFIKGRILNKRVQFAFCLSLEMADKESPYRQYFNTIPTSYLNPICHNSETQFQFKPFIEKLKIKRSNIVDQITKLLSITENPPSLKQVLRCFAIVESRTLYYPTQLDPKSQVGVLVPLYDMANHSESVNAHNIFNLFYYDKQSQSYILKAFKDYEKDEQVYISYGSYDNQHFVEYYGFIPFENPNNIKLELMWNRIPINYEQKDLKLNLIKIKFPQQIEDLKTLKLNQSTEVYIDSKGQIQSNQLFKLLCLKKIEGNFTNIKELNSLFNKLGNDFYKVQQYHTMLNRLQQELLSKYNTNLEFDKQTYPNTQDPFVRLCIEYRIILKSQISKISQANE